MLHGLLFNRPLFIKIVGRVFLLGIKHLQQFQNGQRQEIGRENAAPRRNHLLYVHQAPVAHGTHEHPVLRCQCLHGADDDLCKGVT